MGKRSLRGKWTAGREIRAYTTGLDRTEFGEIKVYEKDTGVGLGMDSEVKTKFHVLKVLACDELRPYYKIEGKKSICIFPVVRHTRKLLPTWRISW